MATEKVVIDPITRIEGHLRTELERKGNQIKTAWSETTQFRGIETIVKNRDPRDVWAFVGRICGVCTGTHSVASIAAIEDVIGSTPPPQVRRIRDLVTGLQEIHDYVAHFYHLYGLDWIDVTKALGAGSKKTVEFAQSIGSTWKGNNEETFARVKETVRGIVDSGQLSIFIDGYWGHEDYRSPPEANLMAVSRYLGALALQHSIIWINTVFGGKNPHPNFLVGGIAYSIDPERSETVNQVGIDQIKSWTDEIVEFVNDCFYPDAVAITSVYKDYFDIGRSSDNFLAVGMAGAIYSGDPAKSRVQTVHPNTRPGVILDGDYTKLHPFQPGKIEEFVNSAWYTQEAGDNVGLKPYDGETTANYTGPKPPYEWLSDNERYTQLEAPQCDGRTVQVGPVARVLLVYLQKELGTMRLADGVMDKLDLCIEQINSTAGCTYACAVESVTTANYLADHIFPEFVEALKSGDIDVFDNSRWGPTSWPEKYQGVGFLEVARGVLSHWVKIENGKVTDYQAVVPTTWLAGGRDPKGQLGPYEHALTSDSTHPLVDPKQPLEPLRTIHSLDPCMVCAVHILNPAGQEMFKVTTA